MTEVLAAVGPHEDTVRVLQAWRPADHGQESLRHAYLGFLDACPEACLRRNVPGHITASTVVLDETGERVLLTLHPRFGRWLQVGGHCEPDDTTLVGAALREATEESGISDLAIDPVPVQLYVCPVTCSLGVPTRHFDVRFLARAPKGATPVRSHESVDLRWWPVNALPDGDKPDDLPGLVTAALSRAT